MSKGILKPKNHLLSGFISLTKTWQQEFFTATVKWSLKEKFNGGFILHTSFNASLAVDPFTVEKVNFFLLVSTFFPSIFHYIFWTCCVQPNSGPVVSQVPAIEATRIPEVIITTALEPLL